ncbi:MAG: DUF4320 family protein [Alkaliphilus sp.]
MNDLKTKESSMLKLRIKSRCKTNSKTSSKNKLKAERQTKFTTKFKNRIKSILKSNSGEGYIDTATLVIVVMLTIALAVNVYPVFIIKSELNLFANELARIAEIEGEIGSVTRIEANKLKSSIGIDPQIHWSRTGKIQINEAFYVTVEKEVDIGFFEFGSFPITLKSKATGRSEVYHK